jgi:hypothetical protein
MSDHARGGGAPSTIADADLFDGVTTLAAVVLAFLAFDDITTDNSTSFRMEYTSLLACSVWGIVLIVRLARRGRRTLAGACTGLLLAVLWGQQGIGPGARPSWQAEYVAATAAVGGFPLMAIYLLTLGIRRLERRLGGSDEDTNVGRGAVPGDRARRVPVVRHDAKRQSGDRSVLPNVDGCERKGAHGVCELLRS